LVAGVSSADSPTQRTAIGGQTDVTDRESGEVLTEFLEEVESWREPLARNIALRNKGLTRI
ncbi:MAG: hypothetical protein JSU63_08765, partial [Phycisphaerales bacterium]